MKLIKNPIIRGFNPDPSILRVGDDYYIVTSTFEWFPGYQIHHSRDLRNWKLVGRPLNRTSQLDLLGVPDSCGAWAPCLSYYEGIFYLVFSNVRSFDGHWKDTPNFLVTSRNILDDWSEPVYLNASGFDASLFHDDDGRSWLTNMLLDHRNNKLFGGIVVQEYDKENQKLVGDIHYIFRGTELGCTEGPHIYKRNGYYYLLTAEGGTGFQHAITMARSRSITGPYEVHPQNPLLTARNNPDLYLQKTGHGDIVQTPDGNWYAVFLASRPISKRGRCILGRETAIEKMEWRDDWLYLACGGNEARSIVEASGLPEYPFPEEAERIDFDTPDLDINFQALRIPMTEDWISLKDRPGFLRLYGQESLSSCFRQSLVARRVQAHYSEASTCIEFEPVSFQQIAGLVCYYNTVHFHYLHIFGSDDTRKKFLGIISCDNFKTSEPAGEAVDITDSNRIYLKAEFNNAILQFYYAVEENKWVPIGPVLDGSILSDDYVENSEEKYHPCFTGAFYGLCCQDLSGQNLHADFDWFEYKEIKP